MDTKELTLEMIDVAFDKAPHKPMAFYFKTIEEMQRFKRKVLAQVPEWEDLYLSGDIPL